MTIAELIRHTYRFIDAMNCVSEDRALTEYEVLSLEASHNMVTGFSRQMVHQMEKDTRDFLKDNPPEHEGEESGTAGC